MNAAVGAKLQFSSTSTSRIEYQFGAHLAWIDRPIKLSCHAGFGIHQEENPTICVCSLLIFVLWPSTEQKPVTQEKAWTPSPEYGVKNSALCLPIRDNQQYKVCI